MHYFAYKSRRDTCIHTRLHPQSHLNRHNMMWNLLCRIYLVHFTYTWHCKYARVYTEQKKKKSVYNLDAQNQGWHNTHMYTRTHMFTRVHTDVCTRYARTGVHTWQCGVCLFAHCMCALSSVYTHTQVCVCLHIVCVYIHLTVRQCLHIVCVHCQVWRTVKCDALTSVTHCQVYTVYRHRCVSVCRLYVWVYSWQSVTCAHLLIVRHM